MGLENKIIITLPHPEDDNGTWEYWDEIIAWCLDQYGIPGKRFMTTATSDSMDFIFEDDKDAVLFSLRWV